MTASLKLALLTVAFLLFIMAGFGVPSGRYSLIAFGLAALTASFLVP